MDRRFVDPYDVTLTVSVDCFVCFSDPSEVEAGDVTAQLEPFPVKNISVRKRGTSFQRR